MHHKQLLLPHKRHPVLLLDRLTALPANGYQQQPGAQRPLSETCPCTAEHLPPTAHPVKALCCSQRRQGPSTHSCAACILHSCRSYCYCCCCVCACSSAAARAASCYCCCWCPCPHLLVYSCGAKMPGLSSVGRCIDHASPAFSATTCTDRSTRRTTGTLSGPTRSNHCTPKLLMQAGMDRAQSGARVQQALPLRHTAAAAAAAGGRQHLQPVRSHLHQELHKDGVPAVGAGPQCLRLAPKHRVHALAGPHKQLGILNPLRVHVGHLALTAPQALLEAPAAGGKQQTGRMRGTDQASTLGGCNTWPAGCWCVQMSLLPGSTGQLQGKDTTACTPVANIAASTSTYPCQGSNLRQLTVLKSAVVLMQT